MIRGALEPARRTRRARINRDIQPDKRVVYELYDRQFDFVTSAERFTAFIGGIGSGKTVSGAVKAVHASSQQKPTLGVVVAPTYPMLRDATVRTFLDVAGDLVLKFNKSDMEATLINGSEILFRSAEHPDRLRGPTIHWSWIDEAALCHDQTWDLMLGRLRADGLAGPMWITGTPKGMNWVARRLPLMTLFRAATRLNPYLHPDYVRALERTYSGQFALQELEGEFVKYEGLVYEEFEPFMVEDLGDDVRFDTVIAGGDAGFINPAVLLVIGFLPDDTIYVVDEFYASRRLNSEVADQAATFDSLYSPDIWYLDPSAASLRAELEERGLDVDPAKNKVFDGIQTVKQLLGTGRLKIHPRCVNTIAEMSTYIWKDGDASKEEPVKQNDHAMDALRYALHTHLAQSLTGSIFY